ncbi:helix-turn-helix domain-containing protein [Cellulomonas sp. NS3]|uniref:helix-turn-helix domain-containing protein n=1 Tax=Cellulomonas sp. NS3 TaxID=2973977 RepID=UPI0021624D34|nr:helix-turn-helix domain-containing protein [Cellulomonas sp. NS3]
MTEAPTDRRVALKARHRQAIVDAAAALIAETGGLRFTIDDLARRADVSRRTVFNHFASVDDIVAEVFGDVIGTLVASYERESGTSPSAHARGPVGRGDDARGPLGHGDRERSADGRAVVFDELARAVRSTDLVAPMAFLTQSLRSHDEHSPAIATVLLRVLDAARGRLAAAVLVRHPGADVLDVHLLVNAVVSGVLVLHRHWDAATGAVDDEPSRAVWAALVDRLLDRTGHGFATDDPATS